MLSNSVGEEGRASNNKQHKDLTFTTAEQSIRKKINEQCSCLERNYDGRLVASKAQTSGLIASIKDVSYRK